MGDKIFRIIVIGAACYTLLMALARYLKIFSFSIVMKSAKSGVLTGIVLAISRIAGETAPLIMTILGTSLFFTNL
jgi:ABC-type phosphate transport system permease subunit